MRKVGEIILKRWIGFEFGEMAGGTVLLLYGLLFILLVIDYLFLWFFIKGVYVGICSWSEDEVVE